MNSSLTLINTIALPETPRSFYHLSLLCDDLVDLSPGYPAPSAWHYLSEDKSGKVELLQVHPYIYFRIEYQSGTDYGLVTSDGKLEILRSEI
jgi:hypothetical protein